MPTVRVDRFLTTQAGGFILTQAGGKIRVGVAEEAHASLEAELETDAFLGGELETEASLESELETDASLTGELETDAGLDAEDHCASQNRPQQQRRTADGRQPQLVKVPAFDVAHQVLGGDARAA